MATLEDLPDRCNFSSATTLLAIPSLPEVGVKVLHGQYRPKPTVFLRVAFSAIYGSSKIPFVHSGNHPKLCNFSSETTTEKSGQQGHS